MLQARPLYDTEADRRFFVEPSGWDRLVGAVKHRFNVAVVAPRGAGKSTALRQLQRNLRDSQIPVAYVDATLVDDVGQLVAVLEHALTGDRGVVRNLRDDMASVAGALAGSPPGTTSLRIVQRLRALAAVADTVILVDAAHAARPAHDLFGRLRDELWQLPHRWVVAVDDAERSILLAPPADAFFEQVVTLDLSAPAILKLLQAREPDLPDHVQRQIAQTAPTARAALQAVRDALTSPTADDPLAAAMWRQEAAGKLGRPHGMAMAELEALGGASASDDEFLRRMGWTRPRASQVLGELAQHNLVVPTDEQTPGGGRPRRVYRPAAPPLGAMPATRSTALEVREP